MEGSSEPTEKVFKSFQGGLPIVLHPSPEKVLVIGLGTGLSLFYNLQPQVKSMTCVEYSNGVILASKYFEDENGNVIDHSKVNLIHQDGRNFLKLSSEQYDLIIQDLFFPYQTGVGNLYTLEHFRQIKSHLKPGGGGAAQWIALHQVGTKELKSIVKTFHQVFPHMTVWLQGRFLLLYGTSEPREIRWRQFRKNFRVMSGLNQTNPYDLISLFLTDGESLKDWYSPVFINTDNNLLIEHRTPLVLDDLDSIGLGQSNISNLLSYFKPVTGILTEFTPSQRIRINRFVEARKIYLEGVEDYFNNKVKEGLEQIQKSYRLNPHSYYTRIFLEENRIEKATTAMVSGDDRKGKRWLLEALKFNPQSRSANPSSS